MHLGRDAGQTLTQRRIVLLSRLFDCVARRSGCAGRRAHQRTHVSQVVAADGDGDQPRVSGQCIELRRQFVPRPQQMRRRGTTAAGIDQLQTAQLRQLMRRVQLRAGAARR